jgi:hypothetical protein
LIDAHRFPCVVGDVVVRLDAGGGEEERDEAWLAGAIVLREDAQAACVLFIAPDAGGDRAVYARSRPDETLAWLAPVAVEVGREPPSALEIGGARFERVRRLPMRAAVLGEHAPDLGATVLVGEYAGAGGAVAVVLAGSVESRVWRGVKLAKDDYEVWKSGERP